MTYRINGSLTTNTLVNQCVCFVFIVILFAPLSIGMLAFWGGNNSVTGENRHKEAWPATALLTTDFTRYTAQVNRFMTDHIGFRKSFLKLHAKFQYRILNKTISHKAIVANSGWLFYSENNVLKNAHELPAFGEKEASEWLKPMLEYQRLIERHGGKLIVLLVPEKHHVYSEYLPSHYQYTRDGRRADVIGNAAERSGVTVINLLDSMLAEKHVGKLYLKSDSHWTQRGAYVAYRDVVKELRRHHTTLPFNSWDKLDNMGSVRSSGDLATLLNLNEEFEEEYERHIPVHKQKGKSVETLNRQGLLLVGDSFSARLHDFLPSSFVGTLFVHHHFRTLPTEVVTQRKPDVVIVEIIERALDSPFELSIN